MAFDFICPHCHSKFYVEESLRGKAGNCAECGKTIVMPGRSNEHMTSIESDNVRREINDRKKRLAWLRAAFTAGGVIFVVAIGYAGFFLLWPEIEIMRERYSMRNSINNMQRIVSALNAYAAEHGSYPPPTVTNSAGLPMYSWRVLILPQLGYQNLYEQFELDKPWDDAANMSLLMQMPEVYRSTTNDNYFLDSDTPYTLLTGAGTFFPLSGPISADKAADSLDETILVTEAERNQNGWTYPDDIKFNGAMVIGSRSGVDLGIGRKKAIIAVTASNKPLVIPHAVTGFNLNALITVSGREIIPPNEYDLEKLPEIVRQ